MFAVVEISGKQEIVGEKSIISVLKIKGVKEKDKIVFDKVLLTFSPDAKKVEIGNPYLEGKKVEAKVLNPVLKGEKIVGAKFKKRKRYTRQFSQRQEYTKVEILKVS